MEVLEPVNTFALQFFSSMIDGCVTHLVKPEIHGFSFFINLVPFQREMRRQVGKTPAYLLLQAQMD